MHEAEAARTVRLPDLGGVRQVAGRLDARGLRFGLAVSRFNPDLTEALASSAVACLRELGAADEDLTVIWVPGAYELPSALARLAATDGRRAAYIALGCVIEGETPHAEQINRQVSLSLAALARELGVPVIYEAVPARTRAQAEERCLGGRGSRGWYAAEAAVEMARLFENLGAS